MYNNALAESIFRYPLSALVTNLAAQNPAETEANA